MTRVGVGLRDQEDEVRARAVGDERLRAADHVFVSVADRLGSDSGDVRAGLGLGDPEAADLLALDPRHEVALLLLLGAEQVDRGQDHVGLDREAHVGAARARVAHALGADQRVVVVAALAAVLLREAEAEVAELAGATHRLVGPGRLLPLVAVRPELLLHPGLHRLAQVLVLVGEEKVLAARLVLGLDDGRCGHLFAPCRGRRSRSWRACEQHRVLLHTLCYRGRRGRASWCSTRSSDGVATVTLNDPEKRNRLSGEMLAPARRGGRARPATTTDARALVLTGAGKAFCAGADLGGFGSDAPAIQKHFGTDLFLEFFRLMPRLGKPSLVRRQRTRASPAGWAWRSRATW